MTDLVEIVERGSCLEIHLDRADKKNAITSAMYAAMAGALRAVESRGGVRSVLFAGKGSAFCAGNDLSDFLSVPMNEASPVLAFLNAISTTTKVMIAAVQGPCVGIGATLLLHCDHVVAAPSAHLHYNFTRVALVPEAASSLLLVQAVGRRKAAELLLLGDPVPAAEAAALGLVSRVVGEGEQLHGARAFAGRLDALAPQAVAATRALIAREPESVADRMSAEMTLFLAQLKSAEFREAVAAFQQKRAPDFNKRA